MHKLNVKLATLQSEQEKLYLGSHKNLLLFDLHGWKIKQQMMIQSVKRKMKQIFIHLRKNTYIQIKMMTRNKK